MRTHGEQRTDTFPEEVAAKVKEIRGPVAIILLYEDDEPVEVTLMFDPPLNPTDDDANPNCHMIARVLPQLLSERMGKFASHSYTTKPIAETTRRPRRRRGR